MKAQELNVICCYTGEGAAVRDVIHSSFAVFLKRELEGHGPSKHAGQPG